jgi:hypothetical protein
LETICQEEEVVAVQNLSEIHLQGQAGESDPRLEKLIENNELSC